MAFIEKGMVAVMDPARAESDEIRITLVLHPGDHVGEMGLMEKRPRTATVVALVWTNVNVLERVDWERTRAAFPREAEAVRQDLISHERRASNAPKKAAITSRRARRAKAEKRGSSAPPAFRSQHMSTSARAANHSARKRVSLARVI